MTIALQRESNTNTVYFDAVLNYSSTYQSKLTQHPIDGKPYLNSDGTYITSVSDNVVTENPTFSIKGVVSSADFNTNRPQDSTLKIINDNPMQSTVSVLTVGDTVISKAISSFLPVNIPSQPLVTMDDPRSVDVIQAVRNELINIRNARETVTLIEFGLSLHNPTLGLRTSQAPIPNLVITNLQFHEDPNTGSSLDVEITLQQATFVTLETTTVPRVNTSFSKKAAPIEYKGPLSRNQQTTILQDIQTSGVQSAIDMVNSIIHPNGNAIKTTVKALQDAGINIPQ